MKKAIVMLVTVLVPGLWGINAYAACYSGQEWKKDGNKFYVCIKGEESWANRHKAEGVCTRIKGSKCDAVNTYSSSCNGQCYDESGAKHHSLSGY